VCRSLGITDQTYYRWRKEYGGMGRQQALRLKELEKENVRLKQMYANLSLQYEVLKDIVEKKLPK
jgi:putative transposase